MMRLTRWTTSLAREKTKRAEEDSMKRLMNTIITSTVLLVSVPLAEAIDITLAEVQNGVAVVHGNKAAKQATIVWGNWQCWAND
jgi:hypothetical protein